MAFWTNIKFKYRLSIFNENTLEEVVGLRVSKLNGLSVLLSVLAVLFLVAACIIAFTPLRNYLPGYMNSQVRKQIVDNALRVDSLQERLDKYEHYLSNVKDLMSGTVRPDTVLSMEDFLSMQPKDTLMQATEREKAFRQAYEEQEKYNLTSGLAPSESDVPLLYPPVPGRVEQPFDLRARKYVTTIETQRNIPVLATMDGTVVMSAYVVGEGYVMVVQHKQDFLSVYKQCGRLLRSVGETVTSGQVVALTKNDEKGGGGQTKLQIELWKKGQPMNIAALLSFE